MKIQTKDLSTESASAQTDNKGNFDVLYMSMDVGH